MLRLSRIVSAVYLVICLVAIGLMAVWGPLGYAPFPLPIGPSRAPISISVAYSSEKDPWLPEALKRFEQAGLRAGGRQIVITLQQAGSQKLVSDIAQGKLKPVVFSPASSAQIELLKGAWAAQGNRDAIIVGEAPQPLMYTPLVIVAWAERAQVLWPRGPQNLWGDLHNAVASNKSWKDLGGKEEWGPIKFGHTSPETSNSGLQTLLLLAYAFYNKSSGLSVADVQSEAFRTWLAETEQNVAFSDSTSQFMSDMVARGPGMYDMVAVYENLAIQDIEKAKGRWGPVQIYYPPAGILSDHPYAILSAPWVTPEQRQAALVLRDYLLSPEIQQLALQNGFRPASSSVAISSDDAANPFNRYKDYGIQTNLGQQVEIPPANVLMALVEVWRRR